MENGAILLSSYPKSGNTWLRFLLEANRRNGKLDMNDVRICTADTDASIIRSVCALSLEELGWGGQMLVRPAALISLFNHMSTPMYCKTHFANIQPDGLPHCIPKEITERAVYIVRDPRSVVLSMSRFFGFSIDKAVEAMASKDFRIGDNLKTASCLLSSWSNHVASWTTDKRYPVHIVKYEDLLEDTEKELVEVLDFLGEDVDKKVVKKAVEVTKMENLRAKEEKDGFRENAGKGERFFNGGGSRWESELGPKWIKQIEDDHSLAMQAVGYLENVTELRAV